MFDIANAKTVIAHLTTGGADVYTCPASRLALVKLFQITNVDGTDDCYVTGSVYISDLDESSSGGADSEAYFAYQINIPAKSSYAPFGDKEVWLSAGDTINLLAEADGDLDLVMSVVEYSLPE